MRGEQWLVIVTTSPSNCRDLSLGVDMESMSKVLRCASKDDIIEISANGVNPDTLKFTFEASDQERISEYEMKLMNIEEEHLQIPETEYSVTVKVKSSSLQTKLIVSPDAGTGVAEDCERLVSVRGHDHNICRQEHRSVQVPANL